ncbi:hypothetical protein ACFL4X_02535 [Gemmatimonadota bacterium]
MHRLERISCFAAFSLLLTGTAITVNAQEKIARTDMEKLGARDCNEALEAFGAGDYEKVFQLIIKRTAPRGRCKSQSESDY